MVVQINDIKRYQRTSHRKVKLSAIDILLLQQAANGYSAKEVADQMNKSEEYVRCRRRRLMQRIGVTNFVHAVAWAFRNNHVK